MTNPYEPYLKAVEARAKAATPGPWAAVDRYLNSPEGQLAEVYSDRDGANREFIAHARTDVSVLTARVRELTEAVTKAERRFVSMDCDTIRVTEGSIVEDYHDERCTRCAGVKATRAVLAAAPPKEAM